MVPIRLEAVAGERRACARAARLAADIGRALAERGLTAKEIAEIAGFAATATDNPFSEPGRRLHVVPSS